MKWKMARRDGGRRHVAFNTMLKGSAIRLRVDRFAAPSTKPRTRRRYASGYIRITHPAAASVAMQPMRANVEKTGIAAGPSTRRWYMPRNQNGGNQSA